MEPVKAVPTEKPVKTYMEKESVLMLWSLIVNYIPKKETNVLLVKKENS